jgi:hypothetical protein
MFNVLHYLGSDDSYLEPVSKSPEEDNEAGELNKA